MSVVVNIDGQAIFESKGDKLPYFGATRAPSQYPIRRIIVRSRSRVICIWNCPIAQKFDGHFGSIAADVPVKFQSDTTI